MQTNKRSFRRMILTEILNHLKTRYNLEVSPDAVKRLLHSNAGMDALFSFRSDTRLDDFRRALTQLDDGRYGICIACKEPIRQEDLAQDLTRRLCASCESGFNHRLRESLAAAPHAEYR
ncbi:MAG TPA: hypothetical protein VMG09_18455 [Bacteroidota bacterium]|nr:hypothetical protein [Bacteroidota bacterium]